ncbi:hypothetical protein BGZ96_012379 [Linnemannia gamsii]|uniref:C2H2-type domain-containing protein n=1 Tax=Linnemannia gamsii TaxID=64522 RepID=A0ABQ7JQH6_9FUNG|nr:hypothetical protein BGZ96_012379 [Linnemannia gamsii]
MDVAMAMHQQSKRMAGLSITNATGTKVSILNDSSAELGPSSGRSSVPQSSPLSDSPRDTYDDNNHDHSYSASAHDYLHDNHKQQQKPPSRQRTQDAPYETARSSSLTNASTPIYSVEELAASQSSLTSSSSDSKTLTPGSQRSRSLSRSSKQSPTISSSAGPATPTYPFFTRSYSEDGASEDPSSGRRMSDPASDTGLAGVVKRKYSCSFPGCNKCFTTSGHLARHNRIHTGERNFLCLMPGCSSKFSRQDNMMQHYRTHISTKSRRGVLKKNEYYTLGLAANHSQEVLSTREHSPAVLHAKLNTSRQGSRQNSPPHRFSPFARSNSVDYPSSRSSAEFHNVSGTLRHKNSGILQTHQHHTPLPHFTVHAMSMPQQHSQSGQGSPSQGNMPSLLTPTAGYPSDYHHQPAYVSHSHLSSSKYAVDTSRHPHTHRSDAVLASPTSPMTQDVERMEGVAPSLDKDRPYHHYHGQYAGAQQQPLSGHYQQQYPSQKQYQRRSSSPQAHAGHAYGHNGNGNQIHPLSLHNQERLESERNSGHPHHHVPMPPSPQSTPQTPTTKYRFDPIQDCLQQEKYQQREHGEQREQQYDHHGRHHPYSLNESQEDEDGSSTTARSSIISSKSSMTSLSSASSSSLVLSGSNRSSVHGSHSYSHLHKQQQHHYLQQEQHQHQQHQQHQQQSSDSKYEAELSGLDHLAQIVTTYG